MKYIPAIALACILAVAGYGIKSGLPTNFPLLLFLAVFVSGISWAIDKFFLAKRRAAGEVPHWGIEIPASIFTVLLTVFLLRSFVAEPFKIPSSSMRPGLVTGDFLLVNKFAWGIRLPVLDKKIIEVGAPNRGDVAVFKAPHEPEKDYIKRIIGIPGDTITYIDKKLTVNGKPVPQTADGTYSYVENDNFITTAQFKEKAGDHEYLIATQPNYPSFTPSARVLTTPVPTCKNVGEVLTCVVPAGHYFAMGDNRDNSLDGRYWGFVPDANLRGKAFFIWFNWDDISSFSFKRVFTSIK